MLTVKKRVQKYTESEKAAFKTISTSTIGHLTDFGFLKNFHCTVPVLKAAGEVITVKLSNGDGWPLNSALEQAEAGDILVIDPSGNETHACWGEFRARKAEQIGLAAVIVDGAVTDTAHLQTSAVPVFYKSISARTTKSLKLEGEVNTPVSVGGVVFEPGDYVIADQDGIYKFNSLHYKPLVETAIQKEKMERGKRKTIYGKQ